MKQLDEIDSKSLLIQNGIPVPKGQILSGAEDEIRISPPWVLKACYPGLAHKSEMGAVVVGIRDLDELNNHLWRMKSTFPDARYLLEEMVSGVVEVIMGVITDRTFGQVFMIGLGGYFAEILGDVTFRKIPVLRVDLEEMINDLRYSDVLKGFRGQPDVTDHLIEVGLRVSEMARRMRIVEMDLNPVTFWNEGASVLDAKITVME